MSFLADACALVAFHGYGGDTMTSEGLVAMRQGDVLVSPITVWEINRKVALGKLQRPVPPGFIGSFADYLRERGYRIAPLGWEEAESAVELPDHHKDPMDRMLIATALLRGFTIVSSDSIFAAYGTKIIW